MILRCFLQRGPECICETMEPHPILDHKFRQCCWYSEGVHGEPAYISEKVTSLGRLEYIPPR